MRCERSSRVDFSRIRYGQCWEDAEVLLRALDIQPGDTCLSIGSGGDNALAMLSRGPERVIAVDLSPAQLYCLELRVAAYRELDHAGLRELVGSTESSRRLALYRRCRGALTPAARAFWDARPRLVEGGIGGAGDFERYLATFRDRVLPLVHSRATVSRLLRSRSSSERSAFYGQRWDSWRWRLLCRLFFSRFVMGRLGRDPRFFAYVEGGVADRLLARVRHALTALDPTGNPYVQWILTGHHVTALPYALRPETFGSIRQNLDRLEWRCQPVEEFLRGEGRHRVDRYNLSDIFEYMSPEAYDSLLGELVRVGRPGGRLVYWNLLVPRSRPEHRAGHLRPLTELAARLHGEDRAFFYSALVIEEIVGC